MRHVYPQSFKEMWKMPGIKMAVVTDVPKSKISDCENCGGLGVLYTFIAKNGPFETPMATKEICKNAAGRWWVGENYADNCPICKGTGIDPDYKEPVRGPRKIDVSHVLKQVAPVVDYSDDFTDI